MAQNQEKLDATAGDEVKNPGNYKVTVCIIVFLII